MRTTVEIDEDVMEAAIELAWLKNQSVGKSLSEFARRGMAFESNPKVELVRGIPVLMHGPGAIPVTSELVRRLLEQE